MQFDTATPIWVQLVAEFSRRIVVGEWPPGGRIAGVRELAVDLGVNPNTVQRALAELERSGLARSERTAGRFVTSEEEQIDRLRAQLAQQAADDFVQRARGFRMRRTQAQALIEQRWQHHDDDDPEGHAPHHPDPTGPRGA